MTYQPPIPEASQSPYPIEEPPHSPAIDAFGLDRDDEAESFSFAGFLDGIGLDTRTAIGIGAAVGLGAIAGISALFLSSRGKSGRTGSTRSAAKRAAPSRAKTARKPRTAKANPAPKRAATAKATTGKAASPA